MSKIRKAITDPRYLVLGLMQHGWFNRLPDRLFLRIRYRLMTGRRLDLNHPALFSEKLQWLKLHDRNPLYPSLVDKVRVRDYIQETIGAEYLIPLLGKWRSAAEIDFDSLPEQFVLKCSHDSGSVVICKNRERFDRERACKKLDKALRRNTYWYGREWPYQDVGRCIIAEQYLTDASSGELRDYKFYCFHGEPKIVLVASGRNGGDDAITFDFFDMRFQHLDIRKTHPNAATMPENPQRFETMKDLARVLSEPFPFVRVDFYAVDGKVYFGELTFYPASGFSLFEPESWEETLGAWLHLPIDAPDEEKQQPQHQR